MALHHISSYSIKKCISTAQKIYFADDVVFSKAGARTTFAPPQLNMLTDKGEEDEEVGLARLGKGMKNARSRSSQRPRHS